VGLEALHFRAYTDPASTGFCAVASKVDCNAVALSQWSVVLGVPVALWGVVFFFFLGLALHARSPLALPMALLGAAGSVGLALVEVLLVGSVCLFCEAVHIISWGLGVLVYRERALYLGRPFDRLAWLNGVGFPLVALVGIAWIITPYWKRVSWRGSPTLPTGVTRDGYPWIGAKVPQVELHEYVDYLCPRCGVLSRWTEEQLTRHPQELRLVRHFFPRNRCTSPGPWQCRYVRASLCAGEQGKFWQMDRWLLENAVRQIRVDFAVAAREVGADPAKLQACMNRSDTQQRVEQLAREGIQMKLTGTPSFVLDGERVPVRNLEARLKAKL
jgi:uncharacterized membrane protein